MSEYLSKKAVLEHTKQNAAIFFDLESYHDFRNAVLSGAFDADTSEIQRLRTALNWVKRRFEEEWTYELGTGEVVEEIIVKFEEALSTTTTENRESEQG